MCTKYNGTAYDRPFHPSDTQRLMQEYPNISCIPELVRALMDNAHPKIGVVVVVLHMVHRFQKKQFRTGTEIVTLPFSAQEFGTLIRYQSPAMEYVHDLMLSFALSSRNVELLNDVLRTIGMRLAFFCDCGCVMLPPDKSLGDVRQYLATNLYRGFGESLGTNVERITTLAEVLGITDITVSDWNAHEAIYGLIQTFPRVNTDQPQEVVAAEYAVMRQTTLDIANELIHNHGEVKIAPALIPSIEEALRGSELCARHRKLCTISFDSATGVLHTEANLVPTS